MDARQTVLVVEDSDEQFAAVVRAFERCGIDNPLRRCTDGDEALDYLYRRGSYADPAAAPRPGVMLLDLNLPGTDGREVLERVKSDDDLRTVPIVVLTTSSDQSDIRLCYRVGASSYIIKPLRFEEFLQAVQTLKRYWFETVALPDERG